MKYDKKSALKIIIEAARNYDSYLNRKNFLIVYQEGQEVKYTEVGFRDMNFLHLTGVNTKISAQKFYEYCIANRLSENDFEIDKEGKVQRKLMVLPYLHELLYHNCIIGEFINSGIMIKADYFVGDTKLVLSVGFRREHENDIPVTLYSGDVRKLTNPTNKVLAIFVRSFPDGIYKKATYISKDVELDDLDLPQFDSHHPLSEILRVYQGIFFNAWELTE